MALWCTHWYCAATTGGRVCVRVVLVPSIGRAFTAGVTWTSRTLSAPWAARAGHTSAIDAAGAIYVIGGGSYGVFYNDVWVTTDGGADRIRGRVFEGYLRVLKGTRVLRKGSQGYLSGAQVTLKLCYRAFQGHPGALNGT